MSRVQLALNVDNLEEAVAFYCKLFNTQPAKLNAGYANFAIADPPLKLVLMENPGLGGTVNHLGVEVESSDEVHDEIARLAGDGLVTEAQMGNNCCYATQDKVWVTGPSGEKWEIYTVLADSEMFGTAPNPLRPAMPLLAAGRPIRDEIERHVRILVEQLGISAKDAD